MEDLKNILDIIFDNQGTIIDSVSSCDMYNENLKDGCEHVGVSINLNLKSTETDEYQASIQHFINTPDGEKLSAFKLTVKKDFLKALATILMTTKDSVKFEKLV